MRGRGEWTEVETHTGAKAIGRSHEAEAKSRRDKEAVSERRERMI